MTIQGTALDILRPPFFDTQAAAYYVIKLASTNSITLVSYVPDNKGVSARTRMLYAASLPVLRAALAMGGDDGLSAEFQLVSVVGALSGVLMSHARYLLLCIIITSTLH